MSIQCYTVCVCARMCNFTALGPLRSWWHTTETPPHYDSGAAGHLMSCLNNMTEDGCSACVTCLRVDLLCASDSLYSYMYLPYVSIHTVHAYVCICIPCLTISVCVCAWRWRPTPPGTRAHTVPLSLSSDTSPKVLGGKKSVCWQQVCVCVCVCVWMMDWGHGGLQGCSVVAKTNSCACVWGRCFIATQHIEISQINTPLPLLFAYLCKWACVRVHSCFKCALLIIHVIASSIQPISVHLFSVGVRRFLCISKIVRDVFYTCVIYSRSVPI